MGFIDRLFGNDSSASEARARPGDRARLTDDERAVERYRYLLQTAPPEAIEQAHTEAFEKLTSEQRAQVLKELAGLLPPGDRVSMPKQADSQTLARMATRAEMRQPGALERAFGGGGVGIGGMLAGGLLSSIAGSFIGSAIAHQFLGGFDGDSGTTHDDLESTEVADSAVEDSDLDGAADDFGGGDFEEI